ncbi:sigma-70 family RNA polymerase sigma factor [Sinorhizobium sp. BJ1]|uniref:sigma-70 family RNA polymerase sigma factor n=1 Tax=Sinorhizobium sp. BJ1 TaxID=2035455 RepID=UPI000BE9687D|nr:sigma-70 family RNA polymerase sigma factor [Sinorhizobium sp. BJ1]PDT76949.1 hypothetical protein CO676_33595 [Sinorhizobium sp. BJ1]
MTDRPAWYDQKVIDYMPFIKRLAYKARRRGGADDLAQDIYVAAMNRWRIYRDDYKFGTWIVLVARHVIGDQRQKAGRMKRTVDLVDLDKCVASTPATQLDYAELSETLRRLSGTRDSDVLMRIAMGDELAEIGADYGISKERVRQLGERERGRLRKRVAV